MKTGSTFGWRLLMCAPLLLVASSSHAASILTLTDGQTMFDVAATGMSGWTVNGGNIMPLQWFWFRTGSSFTNQGPLQSLDSIGSPTVSFDAGFPSFGELTYQSASIGADLALILADGEPAILSEQLEWTNFTTQTMYLTVFQYTHFAFSSGAYSLRISGNQATQNGEKGSVEILADPFDSQLTGYQAGNYSSILNSLTNPSTSALFNVNNQNFASGDVGAVFEWNTVLAPNASLILSITESVAAPEPGPAGLFCAGILFLWTTRLLKDRFPRSARRNGRAVENNATVGPSGAQIVPVAVSGVRQIPRVR